MAASATSQLAFPLSGSGASPPSILIGVTHSQTCLVLKSRIRALRQAGLRVTLVSSPGPLLNQTAESEGVESIAIPMSRAIAPIADLVSYAKLWRTLGKCRPEMVEFSTPKAGLLGLLAAWMHGVPRRIYLLRGLKLETATGVRRRLLWAAERLAAWCAHVVLCSSESLRDRALALGIAPAGKLLLLGEGSSHGVDVERFSPGPTNVRRQLGILPGTPVVGFVGRLTRDKGVPELIQAFEAIHHAEPGARLLLVGWFDHAEDALEEVLRTRIESHPGIHCTGFVSDTAPYYRAMDVLVLPTWREGFPNVVLEAAATGVPVVTTSCTGARDSVIPEVTGSLIPPGDPEAIASALLDLLRNPCLRSRMGEAARAWAREHYREERVLSLMAAFYAGLLAPVAGTGKAKAEKGRNGSRIATAWAHAVSKTALTNGPRPS